MKQLHTHNLTLLVPKLNLDWWLAGLANNTKWPVLHILLQIGLIHLTTSAALGAKNGVLGFGWYVFLAESPTNRSSSANEAREGIIQ